MWEDHCKKLFSQIRTKVAYYRILHKLKQEKLEALAHISQSVLSRIECGRYNDTLSVPMLMNIADGLQIDMALLVSFNEVEKQMWWQPLKPTDIIAGDTEKDSCEYKFENNEDA